MENKKKLSICNLSDIERSLIYLKEHPEYIYDRQQLQREILFMLTGAVFDVNDCNHPDDDAVALYLCSKKMLFRNWTKSCQKGHVNILQFYSENNLFQYRDHYPKHDEPLSILITYSMCSDEKYKDYNQIIKKFLQIVLPNYALRQNPEKAFEKIVQEIDESKKNQGVKFLLSNTIRNL